MLDELRQIVARRVQAPLNLAVMRERFGDTMTVNLPTESLAVAQAYCQLAVPLLPRGESSVAGLGADLLLRFIATMPAELAASVHAVPRICATAERAWLEPHLDPFMALCSTVHDVWAHLLGPESEEDEAIASMLLRHGAPTVYDFGCGAGHFAHVLSQSGAQVDAVEIDPLKRAFFKFRARESGLSEMMRLDRHRAQYDMVLALNVFDHMEAPAIAVRELASTLAPGGVLCSLAAFPNDGWHQSDPAAVSACTEALWELFTLADIGRPSSPWFDSWRRRTRPAEQGHGDGIPRMNPASHFVAAHDGDERSVLVARCFYSVPCLLDRHTAGVCTRFDGTSTAAEIARQFDLNLDELLALCEYLRQHGHLYWAPHGLSTGNQVVSMAAPHARDSVSIKQ